MGPTSERLAANLGEARQLRDLTTAALAGRLRDLGQPVHDTAITKIQKLDRRVDVDEVVALAAALRVTVNWLLLPETDPPGRAAAHALTPAAPHGGHTANELWSWATGEVPLPGLPPPFAGPLPPARQEAAFLLRNRPQHFAPVLLSDITPEQATARTALAKALHEIIRGARQQGVSTAAIHDAANQAIYAVLIEPDMAEVSATLAGQAAADQVPAREEK
ncbi:MAG TPA: helix-turn-helix transcriptional regulator [Streptosporangiaceae bacterium]|nr:helix-turn-helix transcriptional regulator [Streptosporangiaceae bacterium]